MRDKIQKAIASLLIEQSNLILDAIEGKTSILQVTAIEGAMSKDIEELRRRLREMLEQKIEKGL